MNARIFDFNNGGKWELFTVAKIPVDVDDTNPPNRFDDVLECWFVTDRNELLRS